MQLKEELEPRYKCFLDELNDDARKVSVRMKKLLYEPLKVGDYLLRNKNPVFRSVVNDFNQYNLESAILGKKLRATCVIKAYEASGGIDEDAIIDLATLPDMKHQFTLYQDDVSDRDFIRRGKHTVRYHHMLEFLKMHNNELYKKLLATEPEKLSETTIPPIAVMYGDSQAMYGGDILCIWPYMVLSRYIQNSLTKKEKTFDSLSLAKSQEILADALVKVSFGQVIDVYCGYASKYSNTIIGKRDYYTIIDLKTVQLFRASLLMGATLADATTPQLQALSKYSQSTFRAFQIKDDLLELNVGGVKGKPIGGDIKEGKNNLPLLMALEILNSDNDERGMRIIKNAWGNPKATERELMDAINVIEECCSISKCEKECHSLVNKAKSELDNVKFEEKPKEWLKVLSDYVGVIRSN